MITQNNGIGMEDMLDDKNVLRIKLIVELDNSFNGRSFGCFNNNFRIFLNTEVSRISNISSKKQE